MDNKTLGRHGEDIAVDYLKRLGHIILTRNYSCNLGEVDIISKLGDTIYISEVKTRRTINCGYPFESVSRTKVDKMVAVYKNYCLQRNLEELNVLFSIVSVLIDQNGEIKLEYFDDIWG